MVKAIPHIFVDGVEQKRCGKGKHYLPISSFGSSKRTYDGLNHSCKECIKSYCKKRRLTVNGLIEKQREAGRVYYHKNQPAIRKRIREHRINNVALALWKSAKYRAQYKRIDFSIDVSDLEPLPEFCPALGIKLTIPEKYPTKTAYSLDRIDNSKGYVKGNIVIVSFFANSIKRDALPEELKKVSEFYIRLQNDQNSNTC